MKTQKLLDLIEKRMIKENEIFFSYSWREKIDEWLTNESRFARLVEWINERIESNYTTIDVFNPADKDETFTGDRMKLYLNACQEVAMLMNAKHIILDNRCTTKMRENWEYTICKLFGVHYNEQLGCYV